MSEDPFRGLTSYRSPHEDEEREYAYAERVQKLEGQLTIDELLESEEAKEKEADS